MVTITKEDNKKVVTMGAYENFYKPLGYEIVKNQPLKKEKVEIEKVSKDVVKKDESEKKTSKIIDSKKR